MTGYNDGGIVPMTSDYSTNFGCNTREGCVWSEIAGKTGSTAASATPDSSP